MNAGLRKPVRDSVNAAQAPVESQAVSKDLNFSLRFGFLIHDVSRLRRTVVDRALKPLGITRSQWWMLAFLSRRDGMTQSAVASELDLTKVAIGGLVDRMEAAGFVERRPDAADGRIRRIFLTRLGVRLVDKLRASVDKIETDILAGVTEAQLNQAAETLRTLKRTLLALAGGDGEDSEASSSPSIETITGES